MMVDMVEKIELSGKQQINHNHYTDDGYIAISKSNLGLEKAKSNDTQAVAFPKVLDVIVPEHMYETIL